MAEGNKSDGFCKTRAVLGDLTNWVGERGFFEREKRGIKSCHFIDKDVAKRIRVSSGSCTGNNTLKGNALLSVSNITNENRDTNVQLSAASKGSNDVGTDCSDGYCLMRKNAVICKSQVHGGDKDIVALDLGGENAVSPNINELDGYNDMVDKSCKSGDFDDRSPPNMDKMAEQDYKSPNLTNLVGGRTMSSVSCQADCCSKLDLWKKKEISGIAERVCENKFPNLNHTACENVFDLSIHGGGEVALGSSEISKGKDDFSLIDLGKGNAFQSVNIEADDKLGGSFSVDTSRTVDETGGNCPHDDKDLDIDELKASPEGTQSDIGDYRNDRDDHNADDVVLSQCGSIDCTILPESQESRVFGAEKSMELKKGDECALSGGTDSIKACTCSFCTQAAYMWLDLNYQDIKARVSAMRKIQKEATILAERSIRSTIIEKHGAESFTRVSNLESHLMYQWRSLFEHMANVWEEEGNRLEARLLPLTDLREKCKTDLALINAPPYEKH